MFAQALVRWSLEERIEHHKKWADSYQVLRQGYFSGDQKLHRGTLKRGSKKLIERMTAAHFIAMPHFRAVETGRFEKFAGFSGKVNDLAVLGAAHLGMKPGSFSKRGSGDHHDLSYTPQRLSRGGTRSGGKKWASIQMWIGDWLF
jgi:hypothetical protein